MEVSNTILSFREKKDYFIKKYIDEYQVISLRANIVGNNKCIKESYILLSYFDKLIDKYSINKFVFNNDDGPCVIYLCSKDECLKDKMVVLEEENTLGRFVDIDVYYNTRYSLSRKNLRKCYICDNPAFVCGRLGSHSVKELNDYIINNTISELVKIINSLSFESMIEELELHPKFGLVTPYTNGSHLDMDYDLMVKAQKAIVPFFEKMFLTGYNNENINETFDVVRKIGINAEEEMFKVTKGVNAYKGLIFALGLVITSVSIKLSRLKSNDSCFDYIKIMTQGLSKEAEESNDTTGKKAYQIYGLKGARHQAENGFKDAEHIINNYDLETEDSKLKALCELIVNVDDTVLIKRCNSIEEYYDVKRMFRDLLNNKVSIDELNDYCIFKGYSFGGCADLLIISLFIKKINKIFNFDLFRKIKELE